MSNEELANKIKDEGNALLSAHKYPQAADKYTEAIALLPSAIFYSNRAQVIIIINTIIVIITIIIIIIIRH